MDRKSLKILLIEDTAADAELIQELLAKLGNTQFELTLVQCLEDGLKCLRQEEFDILLLDLSLPETEGLDTVFRVKAQAPNVPIVVLTTLKDKKIAIEAVREGAQDYLVKGHLEDEVLVQTLRYAIERQRDREAIQPKKLGERGERRSWGSQRSSESLRSPSRETKRSVVEPGSESPTSTSGSISSSGSIPI